MEVYRRINSSVITIGAKNHPLSTIRTEAYVKPSENSILCADKNLQSELEDKLNISDGDYCTVFPMSGKPLYYSMEFAEVEFGHSRTIFCSKNAKKEGLQIIGIVNYDPGIMEYILWKGVTSGKISVWGLKYS